MIRCFITDRASAGGADQLLAIITRRLQEGIELIQIREKDLPARSLYDLVRAAIELPNPHATKFLVNSRADVALAAGAHGVHLPGNSVSPASIRRIAPPGFLISVACHSIEDVVTAEVERADLVLFSPIFPSSSKVIESPKGLGALSRAVRSVKIPVLALGGITAANTPECLQAGAAGVAGISLFQRA